MFIETDEFGELFKGYLPVYILYILPIILIISPVTVDAVNHEFPAYRMSQYDFHGVARGCRASLINLEVRSINHWSRGRHCVLVKLDHLTASVIAKVKESAGALLIVLPKNLQQCSHQEVEELSKSISLLNVGEINIPVYLVNWSKEINGIISEVEDSTFVGSDGPQTSTVDVLASIFTKNGYQIVILNDPVSSPRVRASVTSIQGSLFGHDIFEERLPTIVIVAHYDADSIAPDLSFGAESNGSGVVMLLELCRIFSLLYSSARSQGKINLLFLLSGGGTISYQGSKKWLEDELDSLDSNLLQDVQFVLCLETVASSGLHMHVSKPPKEGSHLHNFYMELSKSNNNSVEIVHKKINLADDILAWEHERYSIRRFSAATVSSLKNHKEVHKDGIFDVPERLDVKMLSKNIEFVAGALARYIYNTSTFSNKHLGVSEDQVRTWIEFLGSHPRAPFVLYEKSNPLIRVLQDTLKRFLEKVKVIHHLAEKRDPDFVFYDTTQATVNIFNVKPAVFDLFLSVLIISYLSLHFLAVQHFSILYGSLVPSITVKKNKIS